MVSRKYWARDRGGLILGKTGSRMHRPGVFFLDGRLHGKGNQFDILGNLGYRSMQKNTHHILKIEVTTH